MEFVYGVLSATAVVSIGWYYFPRIKQVETIVFEDVLDEVSHLKDSAEMCVKQVEDKFTAMEGEFKASQAYRMMLQIHPEEKAQDIKLALELAVRTCRGR